MVRLLRQSLAILGFSATALITAGPGSASAAEQVRHVYDVSLRGVRVGVLEMAANIENNAYAATGSISSRGLAGVLFPFTLQGTSAGRILGPGKLQPVRYSGTQKDDDRRDIAMRYTRGVPTFVEWQPKRKVRDFDVSPRDQGGTLDPVSAAFAVLKELPEEQACGRTLQIYDGSKRSKIRIRPGQAQGDRVVCTGVYSRVAGFSPKAMSEKVDFPFTVTYDRVNGNLRVRSIDMDSVIGRANMQRR